MFSFLISCFIKHWWSGATVSAKHNVIILSFSLQHRNDKTHSHTHAHSWWSKHRETNEFVVDGFRFEKFIRAYYYRLRGVFRFHRIVCARPWRILMPRCVFTCWHGDIIGFLWVLKSCIYHTLCAERNIESVVLELVYFLL